jgi:hypothetical protein
VAAWLPLGVNDCGGAPPAPYLTLRLERSFDAAQHAVAALDRAALAEQRRVTVPVARRIKKRASAAAASHALPDTRRLEEFGRYVPKAVARRSADGS